MNRKLSRLLWMFALVLSIFIMEGSTVQAEKEKIYKYGDFEYQYIKGTDYVAIVGYKGKDEILIYPKEIEGKQVYSISCRSDYSRDEAWMVREIVIPEGVVEIGDLDAFNNLEKIELPKTLEIVGMRAFECCTKLESVKLPEGLKKIERDAFRGCKSLKEIQIPKGVSVIDELAFAGCSSLQQVTIPPGVKTIGVEAFNGCTSLKEITIPDTVVEIDDGAFNDCTKLKKVKLSKNLTTIHKESFSGCNIRTIEIPKKVKKIEREAFWGSSLTTITIPSKVTYIGGASFASCKKLKKITIKGKNVKHIKKMAFYNINQKATFDVPNKCKKKYKAMLIKAESFKEGKMKIK